MKYSNTKQKLVILLSTLFISLSVISPASAETPFYRNLLPGAISSPNYYGFASNEVADDTPFTGSHLVSSFRIGYRSSIPLLANFRFYGVNPATGLPGQLIAQIERPLPASDFAQPTITLDASEQFIFTAEPNLFNNDISGGWVSTQFASADGSNLNSYNVAAQLATGPSKNGLYVITTDSFVTILDASGIVPVSFYLEMNSAESTGIAVPKVTDLKLFSSTIAVGASTTVTANLSSQAPMEGTIVKFSTDTNGIYFGYSEVLVKEGHTSALTTVYATKGSGPKGKNNEVTANIIAEANGGSATATLSIIK